MKKMFYLLTLLLCFTVIMQAQEKVIDSMDSEPADTNFWVTIISENADPEVCNVNLTYQNEIVKEGEGALRIEYSAQNAESWGGFVTIGHAHPDSVYGVFDWSSFDSLTFWYYNEIPQNNPGDVHMRFNIWEVSENGPDLTGVELDNVGEYYYSFHYILDDSTSQWRYISIPLIAGDYMDGEGFNQTGWSGALGNEKFDTDMIKEYRIEFSIGGSGEGNFTTGSIILDHMALKGLANKPVVFFNGATVPGNVTLTNGGWNDNVFEVTDEEAYTPETNSLKWTISSWAQWGGANFTLNKPIDLQYHWQVDTLKFNIKADAGMGDLKVVLLDDNTGEEGDLEFEAGYVLSAADMNYDGTWKTVEIPLRDLDRFEGGYDGSGTAPGEMDSSRVNQLRIITTDDPASLGKIVYLDNIWTGSPVLDVIAPEPVTDITVAQGEYINLVTWIDVPGEENESYDIYYSLNPISDVEAEGVEVAKLGVDEGTQSFEHVLKYPVSDHSVDYYYAVVVNDASGNKSTLTQSGLITNTARGVTVINPTAPSNFAADGDLSDWGSIVPFRMFPSDGSGTVVTNQEIDGDADLSALAYLAVDEDYLYFAFDVEDDVIKVDTTLASYEVDCPDLFIGLYDWHGPSHVALRKGDEPDYQFRFSSNKITVDNRSAVEIKRVEDDDYYWATTFPTGYVVEGRLSFAEIAAIDEDDKLFTPVVGMRIPFDMAVNDNDDSPDADGLREGILTFSPFNEDLSYQDASRWTHTWIGDQLVGVDDEAGQLPMSYELFQNYPNPFNPTTTIKYSLLEPGKVTLKIYNILGQEVATLLDEFKPAGNHLLKFDASNLASGVYIYQIRSLDFVNSKKMLLLK